MADNGQPHLLKQIRAMVDSGKVNNDEAIPLILAAVADMYEMMSNWDNHEHPEIEARIKTLEKRDWGTVVLAVVLALASYIGMKFKP